jgi:hypothetical protein
MMFSTKPACGLSTSSDALVVTAVAPASCAVASIFAPVIFPEPLESSLIDASVCVSALRTRGWFDESVSKQFFDVAVTTLQVHVPVTVLDELGPGLIESTLRIETPAGTLIVRLGALEELVAEDPEFATRTNTFAVA